MGYVHILGTVTGARAKGYIDCPVLGHMPIPDPIITAQCGGCEFAGYGVHACGAGEVGSAPAELHSLRVMEGLASRENQKNA